SNEKPALAEVSLAMVDESIFSLSNELAPNIFTAFYGPRNWTVSTFTSMSPTRVIYDGGGRGGGGGDSAGSSPRSDFQDTAVWFPALRTDSNGHATVTFTLPHNLTSWRISAKAITLNHLVGQSNTNIETKKDLLLRPLLPRILTTGDQVQLTTMVHNYSDKAHKVQVTLNSPGLNINGAATQTVMIKANEVVAVGWSAVPEAATETNVTLAAVTDSELEDSISLPLPIQPLAVKDVQSISGKFNGAISLPLPLPPDIMTEASTVTLKLSRTPASTILDGLEYLTGYPYGCVEQTMSRAMPNAVLGRASSQLGIGGEEFQTRTKPLIEASIQKLYGLQHSDGGWGWWYDDYSDAYQTAWVLHGLSNIRDAGYFIDPQVLERGSKYLGYNLDGMDIRTRAYALYSMALAGHGNLNQTLDLLNTSLTQLDPFSQSALALALHHLEDQPHADIILSQLQKSVIQKGDLAYWSQSTEDGEYHRKTMSSTVRTTAMALSAFTQIRGTSPLTDSIANFLTEKRTGYGWGTTNETSFTILGLTDYLSGKQEYSGSSDFTVDLNGDAFTSGTLQTGNLFTRIDIPINELQAGLNNIKLSTKGIDPLYYDVITNYTAEKTATVAAGNINIVRHYLDPKTDKPLATISEGQLVKVELLVTMPENASFVLVEDHLPGGLEALNEGLNSTTQDAINYEYEYYEERFFWQDYGYNYKEIHGDRVSFFITELQQGSRTFKYLARATMSGTFTALPAEAYAMYDEQIWGRSSSTLTIILSR
ncbi:MAG TPA: alpha-2-macroglobulin family protein, partial [Anaerolineales bacterium]|nr:alpha-2-macroglobulin family protein [Anaerolineales bacterium]